MNPLELLKQALAGLRTRANEALKGLPPLEQSESSSELAYGIRCMERVTRDLEGVMGGVEEQLSAIESLRASEEERVKAEIRSELLSSGEYIAKADSEAAVETAEQAKETALRGEFQREQETAKTIADRQSALREKLPTGVVDKLPTEVLSSESFDTDRVKLEERFKKCSDLGIKSEGFLAEVAGLALDAAGDAAFDARLEVVADLSKSGGGGGSRPTPPTGNQSPVEVMI